MAKLLAFLALAIVLLASVLATPVPAVHDLHETSLDLYALEGDNSKSGYFAVRVERTDKIVDLDAEQEKLFASSSAPQDVDGTLLAARVTNILFMFNISPEGKVSIDGKPVPVGMSDVQVEADVQTGITAEGERLGKDELVNAWDRGLVGMKVLLESNETPDGITHLAINELITEVNGKGVAQRNVLQQRVNVHPDGHLTYEKPCHAPEETAQRMAEEAGRPHHGHGHHGHGRGRCLGGRISAWFRHLSVPFKIFFAALLGMSFGVFAAALTRVLRAIFFPKPAVAVFLTSDDEKPFLTKVDMDEAEKLPVYDSNGYARVSSDAKEAQQ
ncbi:hypothetical protein HDU87_002265 [Geranomyces variabilis]|uniref:Uncharacterized protein n=1 Tax=Geranomyces variabilis TaxID=109894 RepID=A0AAD5TLL0_9FUNG|nr:hypothetical protein HDU87_002265 [Geranomyces variabilis]